ncbi:nitrogen fixation protein NifZ [Haliea sp. E17]|uniref:nitrogen fixation protein NifZ n=1 Tax=Haliea sp. E17 TaxID=3401576 RepID=UPI003AAD1F68
MQPRFEYGEEVRLTRNVRNDGTYPGMEVGALLIRRGAIGCVYDVGTYLQDQLIYRVHFIEDGRTVGCREEELIPADAEWIQNRFEFRDKVVSTLPLSVAGEVIVTAGQTGEVQKVLREPGMILYHVRFAERVFQVPEAALDGFEESDQASVPTGDAVAAGQGGQ